jgi:UDP-2,3-diacylglucosamine pyrophosphatase LpxH
MSFDSIDFRRLKKKHWNVLSLIRKLSDHVHVVWVAGNHDGPCEIVSHLIGVDVADEYVVESDDKKILFHHGHRFDTFIDKHPIISSMADWFYRRLQNFDQSFRIAHRAKRASKTFLHNSEIIQARSLEYAVKHGFDAVCCGHTHLAAEKPGKIGYYNSGCWTEKPCTFLSVEHGVVELHSYT